MYIKSMVIDGFKSYGQRTEINGFDPLFNAITGLNGSGKSNILDAICFMLGITNLSHVRATNLQELVYKNGQAGVTKATVTVVFDNSDKAQSPLGYEQHDEVTITRQVVIGGKTKYLINGINVQNNRVQDFFRSVQLNVNNPHFLIMQGRITKVLNMKPPEILAMIEEAAGTRMYESKKQQALKTIEKKDAKLKEINDILAEEVNPTLNKLREERSQFMEFQKMERELEHLNRLYVAYKFMSLEQTCVKAKEDYERLIQEKQDIKSGTKDWQEEIGRLIGEIAEMQRARDSIGSKQMANLDQMLKQQEELERQAESKVKITKDAIKQEEKKIKELQKNLANDKSTLNSKETDAGKIGATFEKLRQAEQEDSEALEAAKKRYQEVSSGLLASDTGEAATIPEQVMAAKQKMAEAETLLKQSQMKIKHVQGELKVKEPELKKTEKDYQVNVQSSKKLEDEVKRLELELAKLPFNEEKEASLQNTRRSLQQEMQTLREKIESIETRFPNLNFKYSPPDKNFNPNSVKGAVCNLFTVKDTSSATALEVAAGGRLFNVVVDTDQTAKKILDKGQLQTRVTFIPLNKIESGGIDGRTASLAKNLVGTENVDTAISLIGYQSEVTAAMEYIFGKTFVCKSMDHARKVTFHDNIMKKCVTLEGDVVDPAGILSGGSRSSGHSTLLTLAELRETRDSFEQKQQQLRNVDKELSNLQSCCDEYRKKKQAFDVKAHELRIIQQRLEQTAHHRQVKEVEALRQELEQLRQTSTECSQSIKEGQVKVKELEEQLKNADQIRQKQLEQVEAELKRCQKKAEASRVKWKEHERDADSLKLEVEDLKKSIEVTQSQLEATEANLQQLKDNLEAAGVDLKTQQEKVAEVKQQIKEHKESIAAQNHEIAQKVGQKEKLESQVNETEVRLKQLDHQVTKSKEEANDAQKKVVALMEKYEWIQEEKQYFGKPNSNYDFSKVNGHELGNKIAQLEEGRKKLGRNVNIRAMNMLGQAEIQYNDLMRRKRIVEEDKAKIETVIEQLDEKKKEALLTAWEQVNKDFGSIFSTLLPGTSAKLQPPDGQSVLDGLEVKVAFGGVWKESLAELSGGQRSLVALSLILAMLLFKPAPIYILDEVDAALDLSHTQNIGVMLKQHFKQSQFIVVSLKDGMFNNANVLFKTKFVDGMSNVSRVTAR